MMRVAHHLFFVLLLLHQPGDVLGDLHHFHHLAVVVEDRVIAGLQPDPFAAPVDALKRPVMNSPRARRCQCRR